MQKHTKLAILFLCGLQFLIGLALLFPRAVPQLRFSKSVEVHSTMTNCCSRTAADTMLRDNIVSYLNGKLRQEEGLRQFIDGGALMLLLTSPLISVLVMKNDRGKNKV